MKIEKMAKELEKIKDQNEVYIISELTPREDKTNYAEKRILKELTEDIDKIKNYFLSINEKGEHFFNKNKKNLLNKINRLNIKIENIERLFLHKLNQEQKRFIKDIKKLLPKKEEHHIQSKEKIEKMTKELEKIKDENEVYVIGVPTIQKKKSELKQKEKQLLKELIKDIDKIKNYSSSIIKKEKYLFNIGKKNFLYQLNELRKKVTNIEESFLHKLNKEQKKFIKELKNFLPKTKEYLQMDFESTNNYIKDYYKRKHGYQKEKNYLINIIKNIYDHLIEIEREGIYSLTKKGKNLMKIFENKIKEIQSFEEKIQTEHSYIKDTFKDLLSDLKKSELEFLNKITKKHIITNPLKSNEEKINDFVDEMQKSKMLKVNNIAETPIRRVKLTIDSYQDEKIRRLNKEEERIIKKMDKIKKIHPVKPTKSAQIKRLKRYGWEIAASKIRNQRPIQNNDLLKEEERLINKLNKLN
jgi:Uri superfamily endonuclease